MPGVQVGTWFPRPSTLETGQGWGRPGTRLGRTAQNLRTTPPAAPHPNPLPRVLGRGSAGALVACHNEESPPAYPAHSPRAVLRLNSAHGRRLPPPPRL